MSRILHRVASPRAGRRGHGARARGTPGACSRSRRTSSPTPTATPSPGRAPVPRGSRAARGGRGARARLRRPTSGRRRGAGLLPRLPERDLGRTTTARGPRLGAAGVPALALRCRATSGIFRHRARDRRAGRRGGAGHFDAVAARLGTASATCAATPSPPPTSPSPRSRARPRPALVRRCAPPARRAAAGHGRGVRAFRDHPAGAFALRLFARSADQRPSAALSANAGAGGGTRWARRRRPSPCRRAASVTWIRGWGPKLLCFSVLVTTSTATRWRRPDRRPPGRPRRVGRPGAPGQRHAAVGGRDGGRRQVPAVPVWPRRAAPATASGLGSGREDRARDAVVAHRVVLAEVLPAPGQRHAAVLVGGDGDAAHVVAGRGARADAAKAFPAVRPTARTK